LGSGQTSGFISRLLAALALVLVVAVVAKVDWGVDGVWFRVTLRFGTPSIAEVLRPDFAMTEQ
jgi:hypothetical protein